MVNPIMAGIGLLVLLFLVRKSLAKRQALLGETDASWLPALEAPPIKIDELMPAAYGGPSQGEIARGREEGAAGPRRGDRPDSALRGRCAAARLARD